MPKHIEGIRERILTETRAILIADGYDRLNIRDVAARCGASIGTVYHYFESKEMLSATVMLTDWQEMLTSLTAATADLPDMLSVMEAIISGITAFEGIYSGTFAMYQSHGNILSMVRSRHGMLVEQVAAIIRAQAERLGVLFDASLPDFLANMAIYYAGEPGFSFASIRPILLRLFPVGK